MDEETLRKIAVEQSLQEMTWCLALKLDTLRDAKESRGLIFVLSFLD